MNNFAIECRRALHALPEPGFAEYKTQAYILDTLKKCRGWQVEAFYKTAVKAAWTVPGAEKTVAFRADMDALRMTDGMAHACGHDGHMAILLGLAHYISNNDKALKNNIVLLFQPAEESYGGAKPIIDHGALKNPDVDMIFGVHIHPGVEFGKIGIKEGILTAASAEFSIDYKGLSAHGAQRNKGRDALAAAAAFVNQAYALPARTAPPTEPAHISIGILQAGNQRNVVADHAHVEGILRAFDETILNNLKTQVQTLAQTTATLYDVTADWQIPTYYPAVVNHPAAAEIVRNAAELRAVAPPVGMVAEDFSYYQREIPGAYFYLGCQKPGIKPLHHPEFDFDEAILQIGVETYARLV
ncbi:MAG: M20 family metallopeptidase [Clostridia bacterium]|nr:M20 family metallopeptidase [Clostridia bacterium]